jgi:hypothetical protein
MGRSVIWLAATMQFGESSGVRTISEQRHPSYSTRAPVGPNKPGGSVQEPYPWSDPMYLGQPWCKGRRILLLLPLVVGLENMWPLV